MPAPSLAYLSWVAIITNYLRSPPEKKRDEDEMKDMLRHIFRTSFIRDDAGPVMFKLVEVPVNSYGPSLSWELRSYPAAIRDIIDSFLFMEMRGLRTMVMITKSRPEGSCIHIPYYDVRSPWSRFCSNRRIRLSYWTKDLFYHSSVNIKNLWKKRPWRGDSDSDTE